MLSTVLKELGTSKSYSFCFCFCFLKREKKEEKRKENTTNRTMVILSSQLDQRWLEKTRSLWFVVLLLALVLSSLPRGTSGLVCDPCECGDVDSDVPGSIYIDCSGRKFDGVPEFLNNGNYTNVTRM